MEKIIIFDTTLRDGEQASGFHLFPEEKLKIAKQLAKLKVDVIEAGFPASSPGDKKSVYEIAKQVGTKDGPIICALARAIDKDIEEAAQALQPAFKKRIHTFIATSKEHIESKFKKDKQWVTEQAVNAVKKAKSYVDDVEFSCEDFGRTDKDYIVEIVYEAIEAGASTINLPDTVGWLTPSEAYEKIKYVISKVKEKLKDEAKEIVFSVHNHNDFGLATATSLEAIRAGVRQVECTINGIGERAGNTALEEIVAILKTKNLGSCNINTKLIGETSKLVGQLTKVFPQPNKAIVGKNAFAHEAGIHQDGVIKKAITYETMDPLDFGVESVITFGPRSGRNALRKKYNELNIPLDEGKFQEVAKIFTEIADFSKEIDDAELIRALKNGEEIPKHFFLISYCPEIKEKCKIELKIKIENEIKTIEGEGNGQVDAAINAIKKLLHENVNLEDFNVTSKGPGSDAIGFTRVIVSKNNWKIIGKNEDTDIIKSSINAFLDACNRLRYVEDFFKNKMSSPLQ